jgi:hypothetical protein
MVSMKVFLVIILVVSTVNGGKKKKKSGNNKGKRDGMNEGSGSGMEEYECCPAKKIWGSPNSIHDGVYDLVHTPALDSLPRRCNSPCVYQKRSGGEGKRFCFADSMVSKSECTVVGEEPVIIGYGMGGSGFGTAGSGSGEEGLGSGQI